MEIKLFLFLAIICTVFVAACLSDADPINPLNKKIELYESTIPVDLLVDDKIIMYKPWVRGETPGYTNETLPLESDIVLYGTLKTIHPSIWSTKDQNPPSSLWEWQIGKGVIGYENGTRIEFNQVSIPNCNEVIYTPVTFEVDTMIKGENIAEVTVNIQSGQVGNYISMDSYYPLIWDLEIGQEYLIYLKNYGTENNTVMHPGFFIVVE